MRTNGSQDRPQTIKQAKAAFKARGNTAVSVAERRRLERGAQLLERATRIKEQEQRKKEQLRRKEAKETKDQPPPKPAVLLGTQRRLDKFGYKSSQFHLGAFLQTARPSVVTGKKQVSPEPWDDDDGIDDDTLLNIVAESLKVERRADQVLADQEAFRPNAENAINERDERNEMSSPSTEEDFGQWDDSFENSTQFASEAQSSEKKAASQKQSSLHFSSFGSADFDFSVEDLEELEKQAASQRRSDRGDGCSTTLRPAQNLVSDPNGDRERMPPPRLPRLSKPRSSPQFSRLRNVVQKAPTGISFADLESLAEEDIELSQLSGG